MKIVEIVEIRLHMTTSIMGRGDAQPVGVGVLPGEVESNTTLSIKLESKTTLSIGSTIMLPRQSLSIGSRTTEETVELWISFADVAVEPSAISVVDS